MNGPFTWGVFQHSSKTDSISHARHGSAMALHKRVSNYLLSNLYFTLQNCFIQSDILTQFGGQPENRLLKLGVPVKRVEKTETGNIIQSNGENV